MTPPDTESGQPKEIQIGGQAVIEGVVMRGPEKWALAVRRPCGDIFVDVNPVQTLAQRYPRLNRFLLRGILTLVDSMVIGIKSMTISADIAFEETETSKRSDVEQEVEEAKKTLTTPMIATSMALALILFLGIFIVVPAVLAGYLQDYLQNTVLYNLVEGCIRIAIFVLYLVAIGFIPDVKRVFQYHGAEHKVVHAYESGLPLGVEAAEKYSTAHIRCGTTFIVIVFVISILVFSLMGKPALWLRVLERIAVIPLVAAISYEIIKFAGRHEKSLLVRLVMSPGLLFQSLTTREPDESQIEVAIDSLAAATGDDSNVLDGRTAGSIGNDV